MDRPTTAIATATMFAFIGAVGCGSDSTSAEHAVSANAPKNVIAGAGSTFVSPLMKAWIDSYQRAHPGFVVNYQPIGSGRGIDEFKKGLYAFAASDAPLTDEQMRDIPSTLQLPTTAGSVCLIYHLPGLARPLRLSSATLAGIFLGTIISWEDPALARDNPGVKFPRAAVILIHRSDGSGTTNILTAYLSKVSHDWSSKAGQGVSVQWPVGLGADGSKGVLDLVKQSPGTIGYVELNYARENGLQVAAVQNRAGTFVEPTPQSTAASVAAFEADLTRDVRFPIVDPPPSVKDAYPIAGFTYFLIRRDRANKDDQMAVRDFTAYTLSNGQDMNERLFYAKLPPFLLQGANASLAEIQANGQRLN